MVKSETNSKKRVLPKSQRLNWPLISEVKNVSLTMEFTQGRIVSPCELRDRRGDGANLLIP